MLGMNLKDMRHFSSFRADDETKTPNSSTLNKTFTESMLRDVSQT